MERDSLPGYKLNNDEYLDAMSEGDRRAAEQIMTEKIGELEED